MATNITITDTRGAGNNTATPAALCTPAVAAASRGRMLPGWLWFIALWCCGVAGAMSLGFAFKLLMKATLFAVG
jgi:hypothetical protein